MTATAQQYLQLCKPKVVYLIVFTAVVGMLLAVPGWPPLNALVFGTLGIGLAASSAAAINHLLDQRIDAVMARTRNRPLPSGQLGISQVLIFALVLGTLSMVMLVVWVNTLTAVLTFLSLIGYAIIYTVWLKRATPQNIVIGGAAGAAPPVLGWTAVTASIDPNALILFLIIYVWTPPHFWALAIHRRDDYAAVDIPMLPVTHGLRFTRWHILFYTILLVIVTTLPYLTGMSGLLYLAGVTVLNLGFLWYALRLLQDNDDRLPMQTFGYSIIYLMVLFVFLLSDHFLQMILR
ncbi:MAG: heme o synthase [Xanthomonadales bacterium]|jgi:protoheme IX farnesyltransferase|nr:heme o synthase [Xanthomonadales bacterium]MDH4000860.1 heme o synthase [Xanthomonadales bacterium]